MMECGILLFPISDTKPVFTILALGHPKTLYMPIWIWVCLFFQYGLLEKYSGHLHQIPNTCCIRRLTKAMLIQQHRPTAIGLPPLLASFMILVLSPIAAIAITIKNLLRVLSGENMLFGTPNEVHTVVITEANIKKRMK